MNKELRLQRQIYRCKACGTCHKHEDIVGDYGKRKILIVGINPYCRNHKSCNINSFRKFIEQSDTLLNEKDKEHRRNEENKNKYYGRLRKCYGLKGIQLKGKLSLIEIVKHASSGTKGIEKKAEKCFNKWFFRQLQLIKTKLIVFQGKLIFKLLQKYPDLCMKLTKYIIANRCNIIFTPHISGRVQIWNNKSYKNRIKSIIRKAIV